MDQSDRSVGVTFSIAAATYWPVMTILSESLKSQSMMF